MGILAEHEQRDSQRLDYLDWRLNHTILDFSNQNSVMFCLLTAKEDFVINRD